MAITYQPVVRAKSGHYQGAALVGTHSAIIGWTLDDPALRNGLLGFAIRRTDLVATTLENIIGLQYGFLAVNRRCEPRQVPGYARLAPGEAVLTPADGKAVTPKMRAG